MSLLFLSLFHCSIQSLFVFLYNTSNKTLILDYMKFTVSSMKLFNHLSAVSRVINSKNTLPILNCFLFSLKEGTLTVTASDSETTLVTPIEVDSDDEGGIIAIGAKTLLDALKEIPEQPITFEINTSSFEIVVKYQNGKYNLIGQAGNEYPQSPDLTGEIVHLDLSSELLLNGITCSFFAAEEDELHPVMNGIYFDITDENVTMVASDGHKLVRYRIKNAHGEGRSAFILPKKPCGLLKNLLAKGDGEDVRIDFDSHNVVIVFNNFRIVCRQIEGRYPNYNAVIPSDNPFKVIVDRQSMLGALRRVSIFSLMSSCLIKLRMEENKMEISAQDINYSLSATETLDCQYSGTPMSIGFKSTFLIDIMNNIPSESVDLELADPSRAGVLIPEEQNEDVDLLMLLMPMMLNE
jgi:DNA polymerase-3 subunit beta